MLFHQQSPYQSVLVLKSTTWGNVLVLDGVVQLTERDEMAYQEMIAHLPLFSHPSPQHVLIIGGGDGAVIREVLKHSAVQSLTICEIDRVVIEAAKTFFPSIAPAWEDPRVTLYEGDGAAFLQRSENLSKYDVIITDSSDPIGPAASLFQSPFYRAMHAALKPGGKVCTQAESIWINLDLIHTLVKEGMAIFNNVEYATTQIPTYPAGQIGFLLCSKEKEGRGSRGSGGHGRGARSSCVTPVRKVGKADVDKFRFYTTALHSAAFVLPAFVQRVVEQAKKQAEEKKEKAEGDKEKGGEGKGEEEKEEGGGSAKKQKTEA